MQYPIHNPASDLASHNYVKVFPNPTGIIPVHQRPDVFPQRIGSRASVCARVAFIELLGLRRVRGLMCKFIQMQIGMNCKYTHGKYEKNKSMNKTCFFFRIFFPRVICSVSANVFASMISRNSFFPNENMLCILCPSAPPKFFQEKI